MRKIVAALLCFFALLSLFSCNISVDENNTPAPDEADHADDVENTETTVGFSPSEVSWQKRVTSEEALQIASEYWKTEDGFTDYGAGSMWVCHIILLDDRSSIENGYYHIGLQVDHYGRDGNDLRVLLESSMEHLFVNTVTGECHEYVPILGNGTPVYGKG